MKIEQEWGSILDEIDPLMDKIIVEHDRIRDCTLKEEWRLSACYNPFESDNDNDLYKYSYENVLEEEDPSSIEYYKEILEKCGIDDAVLQLKYPLVAKLFKKVLEGK